MKYFTSMKATIKVKAKRNGRNSATQLTERLRYELGNGHFAPGARFFSNNTLAEAFGISAPTAGKMLDELCRDGLVERVHGSGTFVTENATSQQVTAYAVIVWLETGHPDLRFSERYQVVAAFERASTIEGRNCRIVNLDDDNHPETLDAFLAKGLDGVLLLSPFDTPAMLAAIARLKEEQVPMVYWSDTETIPELEGAFRLQFDGRQCGRIATEHLLALGHRRIAGVYRHQDTLWGQERMDGYREAMTQAGIGKRRQIIEAIPDGHMTPSRLVALLQRLQTQGCTAIIASNDELAHELMVAGRAANIRLPTDMSITGVDNSAECVLIGLTTIELPPQDMAQAALDILENPIKPNPQTVTTVPCRLIVRTSTGPVPQNRQHLA